MQRTYLKFYLLKLSTQCIMKKLDSYASFNIVMMRHSLWTTSRDLSIIVNSLAYNEKPTDSNKSIPEFED